MGMYARNQIDAKLDTYTSNPLEYENQAIPATSAWTNVDFNNPASVSFRLMSAESNNLNQNMGSMISPPACINGSAQHPRLSPTLSDPDFPINSFLSPSNLQSPLSNMSNMSRNPIQRVGSDSVDSTGSSIHSLDLAAAIATGLHKTTSNGINIESGYSSGNCRYLIVH